MGRLIALEPEYSTISDRKKHKKDFDYNFSGIGMLPRSLVIHAKFLDANPYFVVWDCKYDCCSTGLRAEDERTIKK